MKKFAVVLSIVSILCMSTTAAHARRQYRDYWRNTYTYYNRLWLDTDRDGIINYYDYNDRNRAIWSPYQKMYPVNPYTTEFSLKPGNRTPTYSPWSW